MTAAIAEPKRIWHTVKFDSRFCDAVFSGKKKQTIRRGHFYAVDDGLLLAGVRGGVTRKLRTTHVVDVHNIFIDVNTAVLLDNRLLTKPEKEQLAQADGFGSFREMFIYLHELGLPLEGQVIEWL